MKIDTLTTNCFLYKVRRNRLRYEAQMERRRTIWYTCGISTFILIARILWHIYR